MGLSKVNDRDAQGNLLQQHDHTGYTWDLVPGNGREDTEIVDLACLFPFELLLVTFSFILMSCSLLDL